MVTIIRELRGIPARVLVEYMETLGGKVAADHCITGDGWQARLVPMEDYSFGLLKTSQMRLEWQGDEQSYRTIWPQLELKFLRIGG